MRKVTRKVPVFYDSGRSERYLSDLMTALDRNDIEMVEHYACPDRQMDVLMKDLKDCRSQKTPIITVTSEADDLSGHPAYRTNNPVICSRRDYKNCLDLSRYLYSSLGKPVGVPVGAVFGPGATASYVKKVYDMMDRKSKNITIPFIGKKTAVTKRFSDTLFNMNCGIIAKQAGVKDIGDAPVVVLFRYMYDTDAIDNALSATESPILLVPPDNRLMQVRGKTIDTILSGYRPPAALVLNPINAALYAAIHVGTHNRWVNRSVNTFKKAAIDNYR